MIRPQQTRFVLALWCVLTISSTVFAKDTTYLRRVLTTDEEGYNGIISNRALGKGGKGSNSSKQSKSSKSGKSMKSSKSPKGKGGKGSKSSKSPGKGGKGSKSSKSPGKGSKSSKSSKSPGKGSKSSKSSKSMKSSKSEQTPSITVVSTSAPSSNPTRSPSKVSTPTIIDVDPCGEAAIREVLLEITPNENLNGNTPQAQALNWLMSEDTLKVCADKPSQLVQRYSLTALYYSTDGPKWNFCSADAAKSNCVSANKRFLSGGSECDWYGVVCNKNNKVTLLDLEKNYDGDAIGLNGIIAPEIFLMPNIKEVELGYLDPDEDIKKRGKLGGGIPENIGSSNELRVLDLQRQKISGDIPASFYNTSLRVVDLDGNKLTGVISNDVAKMQNLVFWSASDNNFDRQFIPSGFGSIPGLKFFSMRKANLEGNVPLTFSDLTKMTQIDLSENALIGTIDFVNGYTNLEALALSKNKFSGEVPSSLWKNSVMTVLILEDNDFTGEISSDISKMTELKTLNLRNNKMSGLIPAGIGLLTKLTSVQLDGNDFTGSIPQALCDLPNMQKPIKVDATVSCPVGCCA